MKFKPIALLFTLAMLIGLTGCGNKGPLTLPDDDEKTERQSSDYQQNAYLEILPGNIAWEH